VSHRISQPPQGGHRGRLILLALAAALGGLVILVIAFHAQRSAPEPSADQAGRTAVPPVTVATTPAPPQTSGTSGAASTPPATTRTPPERESPSILSLAPSTPTAISIPALDLHSSVIPIGKNSDGTLAVPQPGPDLDKVAWYRGSASPGAPGPSVLEGHVDTTEGPSIFYRLGALQIGDQVSITRADGSVAVFTVNAVRQYATHADFPVQQIFADQLTSPTLRLITCSNFDDNTRHYLGNTVVFAHLTSVSHR
jgi:hypothetical protein